MPAAQPSVRWVRYSSESAGSEMPCCASSSPASAIGEGEVAGPDLGQFAGQPVTVQRQQRVHPRIDHQPQARPGIPQQEVKPVQHPGLSHQMEVVKDQHHGRIVSGQCLGEPEQEQMLSGAPPASGWQRSWQRNPGFAQGRGEIGPEDPGPVVVLVETEPGDRPGPRRGPYRQRHRLACSRRAGDHGQRAALQAAVDELGDPLTRHDPGRPARYGDLGQQDRIVAAPHRTSRSCSNRPGNVDRHWTTPPSSRLPRSGHSARATTKSRHGLATHPTIGGKAAGSEPPGG